MFCRAHFGRAAPLGALLFLVAPPVALASSGTITVSLHGGSFHHGYTLTALGTACNSTAASTELTFSKPVPSGDESHDYSGANDSSCHTASNLSSGSVSLNFGSLGKISVTLKKHGPLKRGTVPHGCSGPKPLTQVATAKGTFRVSIDKSFFGSVNKHEVSAVLSKDDYSCRPTGGSKTVSLAATFPPTGSTTFVATRTNHGPAFLEALKVGAVSSTVDAVNIVTLFGGGSHFNAKPNLSSGTVKAHGKYFSGHLTFTAKPSCHGDVRTGRLSGKLNVFIDLVGKMTLKGSSAESATLGTGSGAPCSK